MARSRYRRRRAGGVLILVAVLAAAGLWYLLRRPAGDGEILVAVAGPMTGQYSAFGEQIRHGVEVAVDDLNAAGGLLGRKIVVSVEDDQCDARRAVAV